MTGGVERLGFNMPVAASTLGHHRLLTRLLRRTCDLSYNEFTLLFVLSTLREPAGPDDLGSYLILARKTTLTLLSDLEDRGLLLKEGMPRDRRRMLVDLTPSGRSLTEHALVLTDRAFEEVFCRTLPAGEFSAFMNAQTMRASLDAIRGRRVRLDSASDGRGYYSAEHFIYWRALSHAWANIVREACGLPFNAYGVLALLDEKGPLEAAVVADALTLARSEVSAHKKRLVRDGALLEAPVDGDARKARLELTGKGRALARSLHGKLEDYMERMDTTGGGGVAAIINTRYYRMYTNILSYGHLLDDYRLDGSQIVLGF